MPLFLCRWPSGDCSVVLARDREDAVIKLDEVANAEGCPIMELDEFQAHFHLTDDGDLVLEGFGEDTEDAVWPVCYPQLDAARRQTNEELDTAGDNLVSSSRVERIQEAVHRERQRVQPNEGKQPKTALGRELKKVTGAPTALIDEFVEKEAKEILDMLESSSKSH